MKKTSKKEEKNNDPIAIEQQDEWTATIRRALLDYLANGGIVYRLSQSSGVQEIAIHQFRDGTRAHAAL